jgi:acetate kinase
LGGLDVLVFTAGVGENSAEVRAATCEKLEFLGLTLDPALNEKPLDCDIATKDSRVRILVIRAEEDWAIATECWKFTASSLTSPDRSHGSSSAKVAVSTSNRQRTSRRRSGLP